MRGRHHSGADNRSCSIWMEITKSSGNRCEGEAVSDGPCFLAHSMAFFHHSLPAHLISEDAVAVPYDHAARSGPGWVVCANSTNPSAILLYVGSLFKFVPICLFNFTFFSCLQKAPKVRIRLKLLILILVRM